MHPSQKCATQHENVSQSGMDPLTAPRLGHYALQVFSREPTRAFADTSTSLAPSWRPKEQLVEEMRNASSLQWMSSQNVLNCAKITLSSDMCKPHLFAVLRNYGVTIWDYVGIVSLLFEAQEYIKAVQYWETKTGDGWSAEYFDQQRGHRNFHSLINWDKAFSESPKERIKGYFSRTEAMVREILEDEPQLRVFPEGSTDDSENWTYPEKKCLQLLQAGIGKGTGTDSEGPIYAFDLGGLLRVKKSIAPRFINMNLMSQQLTDLFLILGSGWARVSKTCLPYNAFPDADSVNVPVYWTSGNCASGNMYVKRSPGLLKLTRELSSMHIARALDGIEALYNQTTASGLKTISWMALKEHIHDNMQGAYNVTFESDRNNPYFREETSVRIAAITRDQTDDLVKSLPTYFFISDRMLHTINELSIHTAVALTQYAIFLTKIHYTEEEHFEREINLYKTRLIDLIWIIATFGQQDNPQNEIITRYIDSPGIYDSGEEDAALIRILRTQFFELIRRWEDVDADLLANEKDLFELIQFVKTGAYGNSATSNIVSEEEVQDNQTYGGESDTFLNSNPSVQHDYWTCARNDHNGLLFRPDNGTGVRHGQNDLVFRRDNGTCAGYGEHDFLFHRDYETWVRCDQNDSPFRPDNGTGVSYGQNNLSFNRHIQTRGGYDQHDVLMKYHLPPANYPVPVPVCLLSNYPALQNNFLARYERDWDANFQNADIQKTFLGRIRIDLTHGQDIVRSITSSKDHERAMDGIMKSVVNHNFQTNSATWYHSMSTLGNTLVTLKSSGYDVLLFLEDLGNEVSRYMALTCVAVLLWKVLPDNFIKNALKKFGFSVLDKILKWWNTIWQQKTLASESERFAEKVEILMNKTLQYLKDEEPTKKEQALVLFLSEFDKIVQMLSLDYNKFEKHAKAVLQGFLPEEIAELDPVLKQALQKYTTVAEEGAVVVYQPTQDKVANKRKEKRKNIRKLLKSLKDDHSINVNPALIAPANPPGAAGANVAPALIARASPPGAAGADDAPALIAPASPPGAAGANVAPALIAPTNPLEAGAQKVVNKSKVDEIRELKKKQIKKLLKQLKNTPHDMQ